MHGDKVKGLAVVVLLAVAFLMPRNQWKIPAKAHPYLEAMRQAEERHDLPSGLLARVAYQESRYREDIITGEVISDAGAIGLMQIVPRWHPEVNPYDPFASIEYAAGYLATLYAMFDDWEKALAAYNFGPTNVRKGKAWPEETRNYVAEISADVLLS